MTEKNLNKCALYRKKYIYIHYGFFMCSRPYIFVNGLYFKKYIQKFTLHDVPHDVTDLVSYELVKNTKTWLSWERNINFIEKKKFLISASDETFWEIIVL